MREAGLDPESWLACPEPSAALAGVVAPAARAADLLYARADAGIAALPVDCRPGIGTARRLYAAIGDQVLRNGGDSVTVRARVGGARKLGLAARSLLAAARPGPECDAPPAGRHARPGYRRRAAAAAPAGVWRSASSGC